MIPDYYQSHINLRHFPVLCGLGTFHSCSFCLILLFNHNFMCEIHLEISKLDVAPIVIRYRVTGVLIFSFHSIAVKNLIIRLNLFFRKTCKYQACMQRSLEKAMRTHVSLSFAFVCVYNRTLKKMGNFKCKHSL